MKATCKRLRRRIPARVNSGILKSNQEPEQARREHVQRHLEEEEEEEESRRRRENQRSCRVLRESYTFAGNFVTRGFVSNLDRIIRTRSFPRFRPRSRRQRLPYAEFRPFTSAHTSPPFCIQTDYSDNDVREYLDSPASARFV